MNEAYVALSKVYEFLMDDEGYSAWAEHVVSLLKKHAKGKVGIDAACGSGYFTRAQKAAGFDVTGVDLSEEMLTEAVALAQKHNMNIRFLRQDMTCLKSFKKVDFITVVNDGVNYLSPERLQKAFSSFYRQLAAGGVLIFDFSTEYKLKNVVGDNMFGEDCEDVSYLWFNKLESDRIIMDLSVFTKEGELYRKQEERHVQYIHRTEFVLAALEKAGFCSVTAQAFMGGKIAPDTQRIEIIAKK